MYNRLLGESHVIQNDEAWILGECFPSEEDDSIEIEERNATLKNRVRSLIWVSYRKNFPQFQNSHLTSDAGWGCMVRTAQMMTAAALKKHLLPSDFNYDENSIHNQHYSQLVSLFLDYHLDACPLSIHNLIEHAGHFNKKPGIWFAPSEACHLVHKCITSSAFSNKIPQLGSVVFTDGTIFLNNLIENFRTYKSLLLLVPIRLGLLEINHGYLPILRLWLQNKFCIGFIGGKPRKSLYFYGHQNDRLLYLDPHLCQETLPLGGKILDTRSYHTPECLSMPSTELDPSLAIGLYIPQLDDLTEFWSLCLEMTSRSGDFPVLNFAEQEPNYTDWDCDQSDEGTEFAEDSDSDEPFIVLPDPPDTEEEEGALFQRLAEMGIQIAEIVTNTTALISDNVIHTKQILAETIFPQEEFVEQTLQQNMTASEPEIILEPDPSEKDMEQECVRVAKVPPVVPLDSVLDSES